MPHAFQEPHDAAEVLPRLGDPLQRPARRRARRPRPAPLRLPPCVRPLKPNTRSAARRHARVHGRRRRPGPALRGRDGLIDMLKPGELLVVGTAGDRSCALWGELLSTSARARGAVGVVMDGLTRDASRILDMDFPVWAAGFSPLDSRAGSTALPTACRCGSATASCGPATGCSPTSTAWCACRRPRRRGVPQGVREEPRREHGARRTGQGPAPPRGVREVRDPVTAPVFR